VNKVLVCAGTSGISAGALEVADAFAREIENRSLKGWSLVRTGDRGLFRDVLVDIVTENSGRVSYQYIREQDVAEIVQSHLIEGKPVEKLLAGEDYRDFFSGQKRVVLENCGEIDPENLGEYTARGGYRALEKSLRQPPEDIIETVKSSGLKGRGGAGFPAGVKWEFARSAGGDEKYIICNADEGDPGAFMDRSILEGDPHSVLEGMTIAGYAAGASRGYIYCRAEYPLAIEKLEKAIKDARGEKFLGEDILGSGFSFDITVKEGAGAFVCGEETALIASVEGGRGMPVSRPPFPAQEGLRGKPTVINNAETLACVRHVIARGPGWFSSIGVEGSRGTKVFALAGKVRNTGLVEVPMGTTLRELVFGPGGGMEERNSPIKGVQIGGPSGGCLPESLLDTPIDYSSITATGAIMGSGGMVVMDTRTCMVDVARFFLEFTVAESCGKCVPCRIGLKRMLEVLTDITEGRGRMEHLEFLERISSTVKSSALCGLGNTAPNPVATTLKYFRQEYVTHIKEKKCPSGVCLKLIEFVVVDEKCKKCGKCYGVCPAGAVSWEKGGYASIDREKCIKCRACINACPFSAIE